MSKTVPFQTIQFSISIQLKWKYTLIVKNIQFSQTVLIWTIQFSISMQFYFTHRYNPCQSGPGSDGNEGVFHIPQSSSITGTSPSDCLVSYLRHSFGVVLPLSREAVDVFYSSSRLGNILLVMEGLVKYIPYHGDWQGRKNIQWIPWELI